ncbi:MAG: hypothetical protein IT455_13990 [Planctomycetes bacterium]|nr:hypothetical protein [Planctomycetota bacterium]
MRDPSTLCTRLPTGALLGLAGFWAVAIVQVRGDGVADWLLPLALAFGIGATLAWPRPAAPPTPMAPPPRAAVSWLALLPILIATIAVTYGALATPSRHWDGAAAVDAKTFWLTAAPTLQQPFFAADGVFHHSPDYPLLLPLLMAMLERLLPGCGRLVLPAAWLLLLSVFVMALLPRLRTPWLLPVATAALALTPVLLTPGGGAVDSGYNDVLLALATTTAAAGLLQRRPLCITLGVVLLIASKPEGAVYVGVLAAAAFATGTGRTLRVLTLAATGALLLWLPTRSTLLHGQGMPAPLLAMPVLLVGTIVGLLDERLQRRGPAPGLRWSLALALPLLALLLLPFVAKSLPNDGGAFAVYLAHADRVWANLGNLPAWLGGVVDFGVRRLHFGTTLLLPIVATVVARRRGLSPGPTALAAFASLGVLSTALPFLLSPEADLDHHLRSSLPRLLLHWLGPLWLWATVRLDDVLRAAAPANTATNTNPNPATN